MAGQVQVRLVAKDDATKVFRQFKKNAESSFENVGKSVQLNIDRANRALDKFDAKQKTVARNTKKETGLAGAALAIFGKGWLKALASVIKFGSAVAIIKSVTAAIKLGVEVFSQFEVAAQRLSTIGASSAEVDKIRQSILALSPALGNSQNLIEATFTALTRGARDADQALQITQVAAAGAIGQFGDVKEAVSLLTQITNAYKGENIDLTSAMDKLQAVAALGNAEFRDLIPSLGQALPIAKSMNISFDNAANAIAQMAKVTGSAQRATIQFRAVLNQIAQRAAQFAKEGVNVREILGERNGLVKVMRLVQQSTSGSLFELRKFFTNIRAINGASILSVENLNALEQAFSAVEGASGLTERNLQIVNNTLGNTFQNTINAVRQAFLKLAGDDSTALRSALVGIANVFITLGNNANQIRGFLSLLSPVVGGLVAIFGGLATVVLAIADGLARLGGTITAITGQITEFTGKVAGLIPGLGGVGKATEDFGRNMKEAGQEVLSTGTMMGELASVTGKATVSTLEALNTTMIDNISNMDKVGKQTALMTALNNEQISSLQNQNAEFRKQASATGEAEQGITKLNAATQELRTTAVPALNETSEATDKIKSAMEKGQQAAVGQTSAIRGLLPVTADVVRQMDALGIKFEDVQANAEKLRGEINFLNSASKAANTAFETLFGKTLEKATEEMQETVEAFKNLRNEGIVPVERLVSDIIAEIDKMSKLFGADSQIVQQLQIQLDAMATKAEQGFKRVFGSMPKELEEAAQKTMKAFRDIIDGGTFPFAELTKKIEAEIAKQEKILGPNSKVVIALKEMLKELFKEGQLGFRRVFGALPEEAEKATSKAIEELRDFVPKGRASLVKFRDAVKAEMDKAAAQFGENSPFTRELRRMLERAEAQLGEGRNKMKRILDQIGVDLQLPAEGAAEKFREAFQRIIDSGKFTQIEMHEIFINQIRPQLLRTPEGVPQVWNAKFGEAGRGARELQRNVESNMKGISTATKKEAKVSSEAMKSALEEMGVNTKLFTGTWLEQSEIRRNAIREEVNEATSLLDQFRGTMNTTMDFGQSSDSILGGAGTDLVRFENMTTQQLQQLLSNLQLSNTARQNILQILKGS
jgi:TP901 family phage tail tape measure protein